MPFAFHCIVYSIVTVKWGFFSKRLAFSHDVNSASAADQLNEQVKARGDNA